MKFKPGDHVVCTNAEGEQPPLEHGELYLVMSTVELRHGNYVRLFTLDKMRLLAGGLSGWNEERFELFKN